MQDEHIKLLQDISQNSLKWNKKENIKKWMKSNIFNIINAIGTITAIIIALKK